MKKTIRVLAGANTFLVIGSALMFVQVMSLMHLATYQNIVIPYATYLVIVISVAVSGLLSVRLSGVVVNAAMVLSSKAQLTIVAALISMLVMVSYGIAFGF